MADLIMTIDSDSESEVKAPPKKSAKNKGNNLKDKSAKDDEELRQLVFSPLQEQTALRGDTIGKLKAQVLTADKFVSLGLPPMLGNQSEVNISFARPASVRTRFCCRNSASGDN